MKLTGGQAGGLRIEVPPGDRTRPTTDRVRESLFASLGAFVQGARVLDLYAGSGSLGLEAASRGAASVTFVEQHAKTLACLKANASRLAPAGVACDYAFHARDALGFLKGGVPEVDLVFADPPYAHFAEGTVWPELPELLRAGEILSVEGLLVIEHPVRTDLPAVEGWGELKKKRYGTTAISFWEPVGCEDD